MAPSLYLAQPSFCLYGGGEESWSQESGFTYLVPIFVVDTGLRSMKSCASPPSAQPHQPLQCTGSEEGLKCVVALQTWEHCWLVQKIPLLTAFARGWRFQTSGATDLSHFQVSIRGDSFPQHCSFEQSSEVCSATYWFLFGCLIWLYANCLFAFTTRR